MDLTVNQWLGEFDPHMRSQLMEVWQSPVYCTCLENRRVEMLREFESHRFRQQFAPLVKW
jgi:hypothetical protein